jgi:hypothetical protein
MKKLAYIIAGILGVCYFTVILGFLGYSAHKNILIVKDRFFYETISDYPYAFSDLSTTDLGLVAETFRRCDANGREGFLKKVIASGYFHTDDNASFAFLGNSNALYYRMVEDESAPEGEGHFAMCRIGFTINGSNLIITKERPEDILPDELVGTWHFTEAVYEKSASGNYLALRVEIPRPEGTVHLTLYPSLSVRNDEDTDSK